MFSKRSPIHTLIIPGGSGASREPAEVVDWIASELATHVERLRVEAARRLLETEDSGMDTVAVRCGFGSTETLRRAFHRRLSLSPDAYRRQFMSTRKQRV